MAAGQQLESKLGVKLRNPRVPLQEQEGTQRAHFEEEEAQGQPLKDVDKGPGLDQGPENTVDKDLGVEAEAEAEAVVCKEEEGKSNFIANCLFFFCCCLSLTL